MTTSSSPPISFNRTATISFSAVGTFSHEIRFDWQFPVAAIDQHGQLNPFRPAEIVQCVHCRAGCPAAKEHVIDKHNGLAGNVKGISVG
jgi:hypothetical protein